MRPAPAPIDCHATENAVPSAESGDGTAADERPLPRVIEVHVQAGSEIVPVWPFPVAEDAEKRAVPKFASGSTLQREPRESHCAGASAIHSAEVRSGAATVTCFE